MRIRSVKPEFWKDERLLRLSRDARLLYIALWNEADDEGRLRGRRDYLRGQLFPCDSGPWFDRALDALIVAERVVPYDSGGMHYVWIPTFREHQRVNHPYRSQLPPPPDGENTPGTFRERARNNPVMFPPSRARAEQGAGSREQGAGSKGAGSKGAEEGRRPADGLSPATSQEDGRSGGSGSDTEKSNGSVRAIWEHWKSTTGHPAAKLDHRRRRRIEWALKEYGEAKAKVAIDGCKRSEFHQGRNEAGKVFDDVTLIFRDAKHLEDFMALADGPPATEEPPRNF